MTLLDPWYLLTMLTWMIIQYHWITFCDGVDHSDVYADAGDIV